MKLNEKITIKDVAKKADVSISTVSRVLNDYKWVNEDVKKRVLNAVEELKFVPNYNATAMVKGKSELVVTIVPIIDNPFFTQVTNIIVREMKKKGYYVIVYTSDDPEEEIAFIHSPFCANADGIIDATSLTNLERISDISIPLVILDRHFENNDRFDCVITDNYKAVYEMTQYLITCGHEKIAFVVGQEGAGIARERTRGYKDALSASGIAFAERYFKKTTWELEAGIQAGKEFLDMEDAPTAIIAGNNFLCEGVVEVVEERNLKLGVDISVIGFEECEMDTKRFEKRGITTVRLETTSMAEKAVELLLHRLGNKSNTGICETETFDVTFTERTSVRII